jgi:hypothetical protein
MGEVQKILPIDTLRSERKGLNHRRYRLIMSTLLEKHE